MIEIHDVHFKYLKKPLFQGLDLTLRPGNLYGLLGKNGAGKTTLLKLCCGLLYPQGGTLRVFDRVPHLRQPAFLSDLFLVPEEFSLPAVSGALYRDMLAPLYPAFSRQRLEAHLAEFELAMPDRLDRLSHGQKKKFLLAFGLSTGARFLLLDEPTNGLDIPAKGQFRKILASELDADRVILVSTHQVRDMEHLIDPIVILDSGRILFSQSMEDFAARYSLVHGELPPGARVLHEEHVLGKSLALIEGAHPGALPLDLEFLFKAVTGRPDHFAAAAPAAADRQEVAHA
jgi:ABC-2 type transport system ATP-binding protein